MPDVLWHHRNARTGHPGGAERRNIEFNAFAEDGIPVLVVDRARRVLARWEHRNAAQTIVSMCLLDGPDRIHSEMRIDWHDRGEPARMTLQGLGGAVIVGVDHADPYVELIHLRHGFLDGGIAGPIFRQLARQVLEHVFGWMPFPLDPFARHSRRVSAIAKADQGVDHGNVAGTRHLVPFGWSDRPCIGTRQGCCKASAHRPGVRSLRQWMFGPVREERSCGRCLFQA